MHIISKSYVKYGLIMAIVTTVCLLLMELTGNNETFDNKSPLTLIYMFVAPAIIWYLGIREKKRKQKGKLTFKEGLSEGFKISLVYAVISPFIFLFYYLFVNPQILTYVKSAYNLSGVNDATVIIVDMVAQFIAAVAFGSIYAAVISLFLKNKRGSRFT